MGNVYDRVIQNTDRTNNHVEAAHRLVQVELQMDHPTIWNHIDGLRHVQKGCDDFHEHLVAGNPPPRILSRYRLCDERILRVVQRYANYSMVDYLRGIAHNFQMSSSTSDVLAGFCVIVNM